MPNPTKRLTLSVVLISAFCTTCLYAQEKNIEQLLNLSLEQLLAIKVETGTRAAPKTMLESVVPIDSLDQEDLKLHGSGDITEILKNLIPSYNATSYTGDESAFIRPVFFRGLPPDSMLLLMNSKRIHRTALIHISTNALASGSHAADPGFIPSIAFKKIELLRSGASSQYGSDAISGVFNFIMKDEDEGGSFETQYGNFYDGESSVKVAGNAGLKLTEKGFINLSAEYVDNQQLHRGFQPAAAQAAIDAGVLNVGNDSPYSDDTLAQTWGRPENRGLRTAWNMGINLRENTQFYSFGNFAETYTKYRFFYRDPDHSSLQPVPVDPNDPLQGNFCWCDRFSAGYTPYLVGEITDFSSVVGIKGEFTNTEYDVSLSYGKNVIDITLNNTINPTFGPLSPTSFDTGDPEQEELNFNLDFLYFANEDLNIAYGFEWRNETYKINAGQFESWAQGPWAHVSLLTNPQTGENYAIPPTGSNGRIGLTDNAAGAFNRNNYAAYVDIEWQAYEKLLWQTALRYEEFSDFGSTTNGKLAFNFSTSDRSAVRGSISTGFRAPTPGQSNFTGVWTSFDGATGTELQQGTILPTSPLAISLGGKALEPEKSVNATLGVIASISHAVTFSVDVYWMELTNRIVKTNDIPVPQNSLFSRVSFYANAIKSETTGLDVIAHYKQNWKNDSRTDFSLKYNFNKTEITEQRSIMGINPINDSQIFNIENSLPNHSANLTVSHHFDDKWSLMTRANYLGDSIDERPEREELSARTYIDLELNYQTTKNIELTFGVSNLFNTYPTKIQTRESDGLPYPRRSAYAWDGGMAYLRMIYHFK